MSCDCDDPLECEKADECASIEALCVEKDGKCALGDDCTCKRGDSQDNF